MFVTYVLVIVNTKSDRNNVQSSYSINRNSINYADGLLRIIAKDENNLYVGGKSVVFQIPFNYLSEIRHFLTWRSNYTHYCDKGSDMYVQYMQEPMRTSPLIEVCGSSGCQQVCRSYHMKNQLFINRHNGFEMVPIDISFSPRHIVQGPDIIVAVPSDNYQHGLIARHFKRTISHGLNSPMIISPFNSATNYIDFLDLFPFGDKIYVVFTEYPSEMANFYHTFLKAQTPGVLFTRIGRICNNDIGIKSSKTFFTSFLKATISCQRSIEGTEFGRKFVDYTHAIGTSHSIDDPNLLTVLFRSNDPANSDMTFSYAICQYSLVSIESQLSQARLAFMTRTENSTFWTADRFRRNLTTCNSSLGEFAPKSESMVADRLTPIQSPNLILNNSTFGNPTSIDVLKSTSATFVNSNNDTISIIFDILYLATDKGVVARSVLINSDLKKQFSNNDISQFYRKRLKLDESVMRFDHFVRAVDEGLIIKSISINKLAQSVIIVGHSFVRRLPLAFCTNDCWSCNHIIDPFCQWNPWKNVCEITEGWTGVIRLYDCDSGRTGKSLKPINVVQNDSFWLIFSLIMFFTIFILVLTVSVIVKYTSSKPSSIFHSYRRGNHSRFYQTVRNRNTKESNERTLRTFSTTDSLRKMTLEKSLKSDSESVVIENRDKSINLAKKHNRRNKIDISKFKQLYGNQISTVNIETNTVLTGWKSCDAVLDLLRDHQSVDECLHLCK